MGAPEPEKSMQSATTSAGACEGTLKVRKGRSLLFSGKDCHLVLLGHYLYCYPLGNNKAPFGEMDLSNSAALHVANNTTFTIKDQTWTTYSFQTATTEDRNIWLTALRQITALSRSLKDFFRVGRLLGHGMAGKVHECVDILTGKHFAVKEGLAHPADDFNGAHGLLNELRIMQLLDTCPHRTLPKLHDAFRTKDGIIQIVMELMTGSNICVQLAKDVDFSEGQARDVFREITEGVAHLHELGISHRDLKPENIFYKDPSPSAQIMVLDFNLAKESHSATWGADTPCGTAGFQAPEILQHRMYNQAVDMWALGCILHILLCGKMPFKNLNSAVQDRKVLEGAWDTEGKEWDCVSEAAKDLVGQLLELQPQQRLTAEQCLAHPWLHPTTSRRALHQASSLESPAVLRQMRSLELDSAQAASWIRSMLPGGSPERSMVEDADRFASLNEALDADLEVLRKPPGSGLSIAISKGSLNRSGSSPTAPPRHHQYGSPGRQSAIEEMKEQLELAGGAGLQDKHFGQVH